jgi:hypothetical protein
MSMSDFASLAKTGLRQILDQNGVNISYRNYTKVGVDEYGQPTYSTTDYSLKAVKESLSLSDVRFVEAGYLPDHYLYFYLHADDVSFAFDLAKDEVTYAGTTYIVRNVFTFKLGDVNIYYKVLTRRKVVT